MASRKKEEVASLLAVKYLAPQPLTGECSDSNSLGPQRLAVQLAPHYVQSPAKSHSEQDWRDGFVNMHGQAA